MRCDYCPLGSQDSLCTICSNMNCTDAILNLTLDRINRQKEKIKEFDGKIVIQQGMIDYQKAEIERLKKNIDGLNIFTTNHMKVIRLQAIKEFAERLKSKLNDLEFRTKTHRKTVPTKFCDDNANWVMHECVPEEIDKLVKEMTEAHK